MPSNKTFATLSAVFILTTLSLFATAPCALAQQETLLLNFTGGTNATSPGGQPSSTLTFDSAGNLYGSATNSGPFNNGTVFELSPPTDSGWTEQNVCIFDADAKYPYSQVIFDGFGNLYGIATGGGQYGYGAAYELTLTSGGWTETDLHSFGKGKDAAGFYDGALTIDSSGNLYGTSEYGGAYGDGTLFELLPQTGGGWKEKIIHSFDKNGKDGSNPDSTLVFDANGNLYGTASEGGAYGYGMVFEFVAGAGGAWKEEELYSFGKATTDGKNAVGSVLFDKAGNLYGVTAAGGAYGYGTVFELSLSAGKWKERILHSFGNGTDGQTPLSAPIMDASGNLYGMTPEGGTSTYGTVYELSPSGKSWKETVLHNFAGGLYDGQDPEGGLVLDSAGNLYGTTLFGGLYGAGVAFEVTPSPTAP